MPVDKQIVDKQIAQLGHFYKWFTKKERNYLHEVMTPGETIHAMTSGFLDGNTWLVTVTDKRVLFLDKGIIYGLKQMELPLSHISAVSHKTGLLFGKIEVSSAGGTKVISQIQKKDVAKVAQIISDLVNSPKETQTPSAQAGAKEDIVSQLERLANLKNQGILTEEEFNQQKAKLLSHRLEGSVSKEMISASVEPSQLASVDRGHLQSPPPPSVGTGMKSRVQKWNKLDDSSKKLIIALIIGSFVLGFIFLLSCALPWVAFSVSIASAIAVVFYFFINSFHSMIDREAARLIPEHKLPDWLSVGVMGIAFSVLLLFFSAIGFGVQSEIAAKAAEEKRQQEITIKKQEERERLQAEAARQRDEEAKWAAIDFKNIISQHYDQLNRLIEEESFQKAFSLIAEFKQYDQLDYKDVREIEINAHTKLKIKNLTAALEKVPEIDAQRRYQLYDKLVSLAPENSDFKTQRERYFSMLAQIERERKEAEREAEEAKRKAKEDRQRLRLAEENRKEKERREQLIIESMRFTTGNGFATVKGEVTNNTSQNFKNVVAVVSFYTKEDQFITSGEALISYNPILPGQSSPYRVIETYNPAMATCRLSFKRLLGGTIPAINREDVGN